MLAPRACVAAVCHVKICNFLALCWAACLLASAGPAAAGEPKRCLLLSTNDSESHFDGAKLPGDATPAFAGSIALVAAVKAQWLQQRPQGVLLLEGGDVLQGRFMERADGNRAEAAKLAWQIYEAAGYDYGTLGNHEFDAGPSVVRYALKGLTRYRILTANLQAAGTPLDPYDPELPNGIYGKSAVVDCGGIKVGLFGLLTPSTRTISQMGDITFPGDPVNAPARQMVGELRGQGAQIVVALTHLGVDDDVALARDVTGIDAIIGGHSHTALPKHKVVNGTWITQTGSRFAFLGQLDLALGASGRGIDPAKTTWQLKPIDAAMPRDDALEKRIAHLRTHLLAEVVIGQRALPWDVTQPRGPYGQMAARAATLAARRALGKLEKTAPVVGGLLNTGGFRSHTVYPPGPVTNLDIFAIHPFKNRLVAVTLTGQGLIDTLEHGCAPGSDGHGQGLVLYGLTMRCDRDKPMQTYTYQDGRPVAILQRGQRLVEATVGGQPIDRGKKYTIATLDYLAKGGSGYLPLALGERWCLDGKRFGTEPCETPLFNEMLENSVRAGQFEAPL